MGEMGGKVVAELRGTGRDSAGKAAGVPGRTARSGLCEIGERFFCPSERGQLLKLPIFCSVEAWVAKHPDQAFILFITQFRAKSICQTQY